MGSVPVCYPGFGHMVSLGDFADQLLAELNTNPYLGSAYCDVNIRYTENREFITQIIDNTNSFIFDVADNQITSVFAWSQE